MPLQPERTQNKWWILAAIGVGTFMSALDGSVVNTILPVVGQTFNQNIAAIEWVVTIYLLVLSGLLLSFGRLGDLRGHKLLYIAGFCTFIFSSALCGLAPNLNGLIAFRGIQALGAAMLAANSPAILTKNFPAEQRGQALGLQATMTYLGLTVGPSLGGWLAVQAGWRSVFYINIPIGLLAIFLSFKFIPVDKPVEHSEKFDLLGAGLFIAGLVALLFGLNQGAELGWNSVPILGSLMLGILALAAFYFYENRSSYPILDLNLFKTRSFSAAVASAVINYIIVYSILFLIPFYLIQGRNLNPAQAGLLLTAQPIIMAIVAPLAGTISDRIGVRLPATLGMSILVVGAFLLSRLGPYSPTSQIITALGIAGLGTGIFISPNTSGLMGSAPRNRQGIAAGVLATARYVGMVFGVGLSGAIFSTVLANKQYSITADLYIALHVSFLIVAGIGIIGTVITLMNSNNRTRSDIKPIFEASKNGKQTQ